MSAHKLIRARMRQTTNTQTAHAMEKRVKIGGTTCAANLE